MRGVMLELVGILFILFGILMILFSVITLALPHHYSILGAISIIILISGAIYLILGAGLCNKKMWAYLLSFIILILNLIILPFIILKIVDLLLILLLILGAKELEKKG